MLNPKYVNSFLKSLFGYLRLQGSENPSLELRIFLEHLGTNFRDEKVFSKLYENVSKKRPIQYFVGYTYVKSQKIFIDKNVLLPGPEMEYMLTLILKYITSDSKVLDLCTGSGVIPSVLGIIDKSLKIVATDISEDALKVAKKNIDQYNLSNVNLLLGDLFGPLRKRDLKNFDMIISNPPYCKTCDIVNLPKQVKDNVPRIAIDGGPDGLFFHRKIIKRAPNFLKDEGVLVLQNEFGQSDSLVLLLEQNNFEVLEIGKNHKGEERLISARLRR